MNVLVEENVTAYEHEFDCGDVLSPSNILLCPASSFFFLCDPQKYEQEIVQLRPVSPRHLPNHLSQASCSERLTGSLQRGWKQRGAAPTTSSQL